MNRGAWVLWRAIPRIWPYLRPYRGLWVMSCIVTALGAGFALAEPWPLAIVVDNVLGDQPAKGPVRWLLGEQPGKYSVLAIAVLFGFSLTFLAHGATVIGDWVGAKLEQRMVLDLRSDLFAHAQGLSLTFHDARLTGQLMQQINDQASAMGVIVAAAAPIVQALLTLVGMLVVVTLISWKIALVSLIAVPFIIYSLGLYGTRIVPRLQRVQAMEWRSLSIVHEAMSMLRVIVSFGREKHEHGRFRRQGEEAVQERIALTVRQTLFSLAVTSATAIGTSLVLGFGAYSVLRGEITVGQLLVLIAYIASVYQPLEQISTTIGELNDQLVQFTSSLALLDHEKEVRDAPDAISLGRARGRVAFEQVSFAYQGRDDALSDVSFDVEPGQRVAIVGPTGAGKTTLSSLLVRFYDPKSGRITIDGHDLRQIKLESLREQISVVLQEPLLFSGTVADNIRYGKLDATTDEVARAAQAANAHEFISRMPQGYETVLGERGAQLSGGERQRISVARAFIKDAPILILDEPTSSIDSRTEGVILDALDELMVGRTSFMIAHRLSTVRDADLILVLKDGRLVEQGTHEELLELDGTYRALYEAQNRPRTRREQRVPAGVGGRSEGPAEPQSTHGSKLPDEEPPPEAFDDLPEHTPDSSSDGGGDGAGAPRATQPAHPRRVRRPGRRAWLIPVLGFVIVVAAAYLLWFQGGGNDAGRRAAATPRVVVDDVSIGGLPTGLALARGDAYISRARSRRLAKVDLDRFDRAQPSYAVPASATDVAAGPGALWVTSTAPAALTRIDLDTGARADVRLPDGMPVSVIAGEDDVWVGLRRASSPEGQGAAVLRIDARTARLLQIVPVAGGVHSLALDGGTLWVTNPLGSTVTRIDPATGRAQTIRTGRRPAGMATAGDDLWVVNAGGGTVTRLRDGGRARETFRVGGNPLGIAVVDGTAWVGRFDASSLIRLDAGSGRSRARPVRLWSRPTKLAAAGGAVYAISPRSGRLEQVRPSPAEGD
jgi:ABC-type multidrug transport system fused ATPase/permease subunit/streptogramin lyase